MQSFSGGFVSFPTYGVAVMGVGSGSACVGELTFRVYQRALHPDWFATRQHARFDRRLWRADTRLIDGGHVVTWGFEDFRLTEVLCGPDTSLPEDGILFQSGVRHERSTLLQPHPAIAYQACFEAERVDNTVFSHVCYELTLDAQRQGLLHRVQTSNRLVPQPLSYLRVEANTRRLCVHAVHTFPEERAIVRSQTLFELLKG